MNEEDRVKVSREGKQTGGARGSKAVPPIMPESKCFEEHRRPEIRWDEKL
jgi:hypothetical protein